MKMLAAGALLIALAALPVLAEDNPPATNGQDASQSRGASPDGMPGTNGWSGQHHGPGTPGHPDGPAAADSPQKDSPVATGADLNGPSKAFPANKSPE